MQTLAVLGSTGSIGKSTLAIIELHPDQYDVFFLAAHSNHQEMFSQCQLFHPEYAYLEDSTAAVKLQEALIGANLPTVVISSHAALLDQITDSRVDTVVSAMVGAAGLLPTLAAISAGKKVLLANKESLVTAGQLFMDAVKQSQATLIPLDSEHNAIFQCLPRQSSTLIETDALSKLILTASGGPFRNFTYQQMHDATPAQACNHPNWSMGKKISVDSATMMNKGLELIEAHWLFGVDVDRIDVIVHPQSIVHSMVQFNDGSTLAQLGNHDMRTPISYGLAWPERIVSGVDDVDLIHLAQLDFERADEKRFPCLRLAREACKAGRNAAAVLNAANEVSVEAFLTGRIGFTQIANINEEVLQQTALAELTSIDEVLATDFAARELAAVVINETLTKKGRV